MKTVLAAGLLLGLLRQDARELPAIPVAEYATRRAALSEKLGKQVFVFEAERLARGMDGVSVNTPRFDFHYLTGHHAPGDILVILPAEPGAVLFTSEDVDRVKERTGIGSVLARGGFAGYAKEALSTEKVLITRLRNEARAELREALPDAELKPFDAGRASAVGGLRMVKSPAEIAMMKKAADATNKAHLAAMRACRAGMNEKELQELVEGTFKKEGCDGLGFPSIVGSGMNGTILHYDQNDKEIPKDTLLVCDIGASHRGYVTDITRTLPTSGKFDDEQRAAYECVLEAQKAAEKLLKAGATFGELHEAAKAVFETRGLTKWAYSHSKDRSVRHGLSHFVGMAVHDAGNYQIPLVEGAVITIEPGYYNKDAGWGIRIEDIYLVTKDGCVRWSADAPREIDEIEKLMEGARK